MALLKGLNETVPVIVASTRHTAGPEQKSMTLCLSWLWEFGGSEGINAIIALTGSELLVREAAKGSTYGHCSSRTECGLDCPQGPFSPQESVSPQTCDLGTLRYKTANPTNMD